MSTLFGGGRKTNAATKPDLTGIPIQTSSYGKPIAVVYGTTQLAPNLLDYANFTQIAHNSPAASGGGKSGVTGGGGKGGGGSTTYTYRADLVMGICEGPIDGLGNMWKSQTETTPAAEGLSIYDGAYPQSVFRQYPYTGIATADELQYDLGNNAQLPNFRFEVKRTTGFAAPNGLDADPSKVIVDLLTNPYFGAGFAAAQIGTLLTENEPYTIPNAAPWQITVAQAASFAFNLAVAAAWATNGAALQCVAGAPATGQYSFAAGVYTFAAADAGKAITIRYAALGALTAYQQFTLANGLWVSPAYDTQTQASSLVDDLTKYTYSSPVVSAGVLTIVPNGTVNVTGNGYSYVAPAAPLFDLGPDNFLPNKNVTGTSAAGTNDFPLIVSRGDPTAQPNDFKLQFKDRTNQYAAGLAEFVDQANVDAFGKKPPASNSGDVFSDAAAANVAVRFLAEAAQVRNAYSFTLGPQWCFLDPLDVVTVSDAAQGIVQQWVRIQEITENQDGSFSVSTTEYPHGAGAPAVYALNAGQGYIPNYNQDPGPVNAPIVFGMPVALAQGLAIGVAVSGASAAWAGADVYVSSDGSTYKLVGRESGPARMGVTTADFPAGGDPDTTHTLAVDLTESAGALLSGTPADADLGHTLCLVGGANGVEYVSYETATLTGTNKYALATYLRRGQQGSAIVDHPSGAPFARLDDAIFQVPYTSDQIGKTLYLKFTSLNVFGGGEESLASVTAYPIVMPAPPAPTAVDLFSVQQIGGAVVFGWHKIADDFALKGYDILYGEQGDPLGIVNAQFLTEATRGTEMTNAAVSPGTWTFYIRARDIADQFGPAASFNLTVINPNTLIVDEQDAPAWPGTLEGLMRQWNGILIPDSTALANAHTNAQLFEQFVPMPVATSTYETAADDTGFDDTLRVYSKITAPLGRGQSGSPVVSFAIDTWLTGGADPGTFTPWTVGTAALRYLRGEMLLSNVAGSVSYISGFELIADREPKVENSAAAVTIAAGGTLITFPTPYHALPSVLLTPVSATSLVGTADAITTSGFTAHIFNPATGADVGGSANFYAKGT